MIYDVVQSQLILRYKYRKFGIVTLFGFSFPIWLQFPIKSRSMRLSLRKGFNLDEFERFNVDNLYGNVLPDEIADFFSVPKGSVQMLHSSFAKDCLLMK